MVVGRCNEKYSKAWKGIQIPGDLLVILVSYFISRFTNLVETYDLRTIGNIPSEFVPPKRMSSKMCDI